MNPLTYLGFTIFSIIMQFCVMEFIHERLQSDKDVESSNGSIYKNKDFPIDIVRKSHALYYRTENSNAETIKYSNTTLDDITAFTSTDATSTAFEVYYENTSLTDDYFTTEAYLTNSEFDNVTEITLFDKGNVTTAKPSVTKTVTSNEKCFCNLLYQKCDVSCCCDTECTDDERGLFKNCIENDCNVAKNKEIYFCNSYPICKNTVSTDIFNDLFCVVKVNLPEKRIKSHYQLDVAVFNATYKWNTATRSDIYLHFKKTKYQYGDPLWLLKNETTSTLNLPTTTTNYYCHGKKLMKFLNNENIQCNVKIKDLHMFSALKTLEGAKLIGVTEFSSNHTVLNCSTLHCTNWTVVVCDENICGDYNKTIHTPTCTDYYCNNLADTIEYTFYYFESKITNATFKMYLTKIPTTMPILMQNIIVKWYMGNESVDNVVQLSGNPGYIPGLPLIVSSASENHTTNFYNRTYGKRYLSFPDNINGQCNWSMGSNKTLLFGLNIRSKCRMNIVRNISYKNATSACHDIESNIKGRLRINETLYISPYGNPRGISDDKWIPLELNNRMSLYGEYRSKNTKLVCYNLATRYSFVIAYADMTGGRENKIVKAILDGTQSNFTFDSTALSTIFTIDVRFIDVSRPIIEFARAPNLNIHLPSNFFFDYPSNNCHHHTTGIIVLVILVIYLYL